MDVLLSLLSKVSYYSFFIFILLTVIQLVWKKTINKFMLKLSFVSLLVSFPASFAYGEWRQYYNIWDLIRLTFKGLTIDFVLVFIIYVAILVYRLIRKQPKKNAIIILASSFVLIFVTSISEKVVTDYRSKHLTQYEESLIETAKQKQTQSDEERKIEEAKLRDAFGEQGVDYINKVTLIIEVISARRLDINIQLKQENVNWDVITNHVDVMKKSILLLPEIKPTYQFVDFHANLIRVYEPEFQGLQTASAGIENNNQSMFIDGLNTFDLAHNNLTQVTKPFFDLIREAKK